MIKPRKQLTAHPGEILQMLLDENGVTQSELALHLKVTQTKISQICRGKLGISAEMAMKLGKALGMSPKLWMNLQNSWELEQVDPKKVSQVRQLKRLSLAEEKEAA